MKLPINIVAKFLLKRIVAPALAKAVQKGKIDPHTAKEAVSEALQDELLRRAAKGI